MKLGSKEHYDMLDAFERSFKSMQLYGRLDRESQDWWSRGVFYQDGQVNVMFRTFTAGYAEARCIYLQETANIADGLEHEALPHCGG